MAKLFIGRNYDGMAVHPRTGDIYLTKGAEIHRVNFGSGGSQKTLVGTLDLRGIGSGTSGGKTLMGMSISPVGDSFLVIVPGNLAYEFSHDLSSRTSLPSAVAMDGKEITLTALPKAEGITYSHDGRSFFYTSDTRGGSSPLMRSNCVN